jgi:transposase
MQEEVVELKKENSFLKEKVDNYEEENKRLRHIISLFKKEKFGSKSEQYIEEDRQLLFNELEQEADSEPQLPLVQETITYTRKKGRGKKKPFPEGLPREEVIIDLPEEEKICPHDGTPLTEIGEDVVEKLKTVPAQSSIVIERKKKYACPCCEGHLVQAKSHSILPKTIATPELLAFLIFSKYFQGLPLYRLEEFYDLQGISLSRGKMARWLIQVSEKLIPIWNILEERVLDCGYMAIDATKIQVLKEKGRPAESKSFMWVRGSPELGIVLFDYDVSGGGQVAKKLITGFKGGLQADAHRGYGALDKSELVLLGCMMHARRRFYKAWLEAKKQPGLAEIGLKMMKRLYRYERAYKEQNLNRQQRYEARLKEAGPYLEKIKKWCEKKKPKVLPKSPIGEAINYFLTEYEELSGFLKNGRYEVDNGWVERMIRKFAIGRNNWLFSDSVEGAHASSVLYSLALTAKVNDKDPFKVLAEVFRKIPTAETIEDYEALANLFTK